ncbi:hypothetical protein A6E01_19345 (plasmid) [Vibrio breoganii]|uniref:Uncharacterized protein n=2 Tax=Vibrio TaxID=662 RepID=A0AAN0XZF0_9VIBR|nr:hypothetical protein [Vibrio breoganii]ANO35371.1 hypothetical protein A6E01_19345 [Vibrio breoganii]PML12707.1 hypothetical protein BCT84_02160 [Vibrio breoganii]
MSISSLQRRVAKAHSFEIDGGVILRAVNECIEKNSHEHLAEMIGCSVEQAKEILSMPHSVILFHALDEFYSLQSVASSLFKQSSEKSRTEFFVKYVEFIKIYKETVKLIGLNASIDQVLEMTCQNIFKRRDWPKLRFVFATEIEAIYKGHQQRKKEVLNKREGEIEVEWNDRIKHSKGRKLTIADKVRISNAEAGLSPMRSTMSDAEYVIKIAEESLVDIVQINQLV